MAAFDLRGHGESGGTCHISSFRQYFDDLDAFQDKVSQALRAEITVVLGQSLGGLIVARYLQEGTVGIAAAVLSSPALGFALHIPWWKQALAHVISSLVPCALSQAG